MKRFYKTLNFLGILISLFCFGDISQARVTSAYGSGYASGMCDGSPGNYFCFDNIKQQARRDAVSRAELDCRIRGGQAQGTYSASCSFEFCNPSFVPSGSPAQFINCRSDCSINCEIKD